MHKISSAYENLLDIHVTRTLVFVVNLPTLLSMCRNH